MRTLGDVRPTIIRILATFGVVFGAIAISIWAYVLWHDGFRIEVAALLAMCLIGMAGCGLMLAKT